MMNKPIFFNQVGIDAKKNKKLIFKIASKIIESGQFLNGSQVKKLEKSLLTYLKKGYLVTTASGHDSLLLALMSLNLNHEDEVVLPVNAYPTAFPVALTKGKPILADIDENGQLDPKELEKKITKKTKAVVLVHLYGLVGNIDEIIKVIKNKSVFLIEDCAQAFGSRYKNKPVGSFGNIACFSFYPTKNLGALGDGGAIWTKHKRFHQYFLKAKSYGEGKKYWSDFVSGHSRLPEIQAGILNVYLKKTENNFQKKRSIINYYKKSFLTSHLSEFLRVLESSPKSDPVPHLLVIEAKKRNSLKKYLAAHGVETHIHYPTPIHLLPAFAFLNHKRGDFPTAERLSDNILSLPFHSFLKTREIDYVVKIIRNFYCG